MKTVCEINKCAGCMACVDICPNDAIKIEDRLSSYNAVIYEDKCIECNACHNVCQNNCNLKLLSPIKWYQGWSENSDLRMQCSSGGVATAISTSFIKMGGVVCSCRFYNGRFEFETTGSIDELKKFIGSKYVKSNPHGVYADIKSRLKKDQKVLFIGLPCQVAAVKNYIGEKIEKSLYTIDLICHGTPSPKILEIFLKQYGCSLDDLDDIRFRVKAKFQVSDNYKGIITNGVVDRYSIAFLNSLIYTENCYECLYARKERISDLTLGDSWGSELTEEERNKGISLILCQTEKGMELVNNAKLHLEEVDINKAVINNHQLSNPSIMPPGRDKFFKNIRIKKFNKLVFQNFPKKCIRQNLKNILIKCTILRGGV